MNPVISKGKKYKTGCKLEFKFHESPDMKKFIEDRKRLLDYVHGIKEVT